MFKLYRFLSFIAIPLIFINICWRIIQKKEDKQRYKERFGKSVIQIPQKKIIWIHAASIGEFKNSDSNSIESWFSSGESCPQIIIEFFRL